MMANNHLARRHTLEQLTRGFTNTKGTLISMFIAFAQRACHTTQVILPQLAEWNIFLKEMLYLRMSKSLS